MPKVSVIMPVYNCESTISNSIKSVLNQTYKDFELIIVNDGSTDRTGEICRAVSLKDKRIKVILQQNRGPSVARNVAIKHSNGEYLMCIDADDTYNQNILSKMIEEAEKTQADMVICGIKKHYHQDWKVYRAEDIVYPAVVWSNKSIILDNIKTLMGNSVYFNAPVNKLYRMSKILEYNLFMDENLDIGEDFLFNLKYLEYCDSISIIDEALYNYYIGKNYLTSKYRKDMFELRKSNILELKKFYQNNGLSDEIIDFLYIKLSYACFMQLFHTDNNMNFHEKKEYINRLIKSEEVSNSLNNVKSEGVFQKLLIITMKTKSSFLIFLLSKIMYVVRKKNLVKLKRVSL